MGNVYHCAVIVRISNVISKNKDFLSLDLKVLVMFKVE